MRAGFPLLSDGDEALCQAIGIPVWVSDRGERFAMRTTIVSSACTPCPPD